MKKKQNKNIRNKKKLPLGMTFLLILIASAAIVAFYIGTGWMIDAVLAFITGEVEETQMLRYVLTVVFMGTLHLFFFATLISGRMPFVNWKKDISYRDFLIISFSVVMVLSAVFLMELSARNDRDIDFIFGAVMFPSAGIIVSPVTIKLVIKAQSKWDRIFYKKGNLQNCKKDKDFYMIENPVSFEKKLYRAVFINHILGFAAVITVMIVSVVLSIHWILDGYNVIPQNLLAALFYMRLRRKTGMIFYFTIFVIAFSPAIISYYLTNAVYRLRIIRKHKYIAFHAVVRKMDFGRISLSTNKYHYNYKYASCVGKSGSSIHDTPAVLIFIPDNVLVFPDEKYDRLNQHVEEKQDYSIK